MSENLHCGGSSGDSFVRMVSRAFNEVKVTMSYKNSLGSGETMAESLIKSRKALIAWWGVATLILPLSLFSETLVLLQATVTHSATWFMAIWWILACGAGVFLLGLLISLISWTAGVLSLVVFVIFAIVSLKLEYLQSYVMLAGEWKVLAAVLLFGLGCLFFFKFNLAVKPPSLIFIVGILAVFVGIPIASMKVGTSDGLSLAASERIMRSCYAAYVERYSDLAGAYAARPRGLSKAQWGQKHYEALGQKKGRSLTGQCERYRKSGQTEQKANEALPEPLEADDSYLTFVKSLGDIKLSTRPNVYVFIFDSLIPKPVANLFFGEGSASYYDVIDKHFVVPESVTMQDNIPSKPSLRSVMWLDTIDREQFEGQAKNGEFPGRIDSPLSHIFRANNYFVTSGYDRQAWGKSGRFIDQWMSPQPVFGTTLLCIEPESSIIDHLRGFGICPLLGPYDRMPTLKKLFSDLVSEPESGNARERVWREMVSNHIETSGKSDQPQFTLVYIFDPIGHAWKRISFDHAESVREYRDYFIEKSKAAAEYLIELIEQIKKTERESLFLVAGDHGTLISTWTRDAGFTTVDKRAVAIALWKSNHPCAGAIEREGFIPNEEGYHTISTAIRTILACLAEDPTEVERLPLVAKMTQEEVGKSWEEFLSKHINAEIRARLEEARIE